jgi:hypothetical protein
MNMFFKSTQRHLLLSSLAFTTFSACQGATKFGSESPPTQSEAKQAQGESAPRPKSVCVNGHRALRVAFLVDNTGSNSCTPGKLQTDANNLCGTDPVKPDSPIPGGGSYTDRQNAVFQTIVTLVAKDQAARAANASFEGSEVGLLSFPSGISVDELSKSKFYTGIAAVFPKKMTNILADVRVDEDFKMRLWELLQFTHNPIGMTPYKTALEGGEQLLIEGRNPADTRQDLAILITDGLPNDVQPSLVKAALANLKNVDLVIFSVYQKGLDMESQNAVAKNALRDLWSGSFQWGHASGKSDDFASFDDYWAGLLKVPNEIANKVVEVHGSDNLKTAVEELLGSYQQCK